MAYDENDKRIALLNIAGKYVALGSVLGRHQRGDADGDVIQFGGKRQLSRAWRAIQNDFIDYLSKNTDWLLDAPGPEGYHSLQLIEANLLGVDEVEKTLVDFFENRYGDRLVSQVVREEFGEALGRG